MAKKQAAVDVAAQQRAQEQAEVQQAFLKGISTLRDLIAPSSIEIHSSYFRLGTKYRSHPEDDDLPPIFVSCH